jgi:hypothetical protein
MEISTHLPAMNPRVETSVSMIRVSAGSGLAVNQPPASLIELGALSVGPAGE